jgi:ATP-binding cassette subfamily C protein
MHSFLTPVATLLDFGSTLQELQGALQRLDDVFQHPTQPGQVQVRNLTFGYSRAHPPVLDQVSLTLAPGTRVAVVGASGSGKSTLARLVCGLYDPWEGEICFDGLPRARIPRQVLTGAIAMVDQDPVFFAGTVRDNLTLWDDTVPEEQLIQACQDAAIHEAIVTLPGGYDGMLLEGAANLSGGQRQRLEIARALLYNPAVLVMDEATSALDAETEERIARHLQRRGCTCLLVAHRLSTIRDCDEIIVLDRGKVVQHGTHNVLLRQSGVYASLMRAEQTVQTHNNCAQEEQHEPMASHSQEQPQLAAR